MNSLVIAGNVVNVCQSPDKNSAVISQLVFGEPATLVDEKGAFTCVESSDRYRGWVATQHVRTAPSAFGESIYRITELIATVFIDSQTPSEILTKLPLGCYVRTFDNIATDPFVRFEYCADRSGVIASRHIGIPLPENSVSRADTLTHALETAARLVGTPYLWGGTTPFGIDCSGLIQLAFRTAGIQLLRDAHLQMVDRRFYATERGTSLGDSEHEPGDLLFFSNREDSRATHVAIAHSHDRFLHSRGGFGVRFDDYTAEQYSRTYIGGRRLRTDADFRIEFA